MWFYLIKIAPIILVNEFTESYSLPPPKKKKKINERKNFLYSTKAKIGTTTALMLAQLMPTLDVFT